MRVTYTLLVSSLVLAGAYGCSSKPETQPQPVVPAKGGGDAGTWTAPVPPPRDAGAAAPDAAPVDATLPGLNRGDKKLIDMFPVPGGLLLVHDEAVLLLDKSGVPKQRWTSGRQIASVSFDGTTLAVADLAILTTLDVNLGVTKSVSLKSPCASAALLSAGRFVCGQQNNYSAPFDLYDVLAGSFVTTVESTSLGYSGGTPLRPVPGTGDFVSQSSDPSASFGLYRVESQPSPTVSLLGSSRWDGTSSGYGHTIFAFAGNPATHLVTDDGTLRRIYTSGVTDPTNPQGEAPFAKDGNLGVSLGGGKFNGLDQSDGDVIGISSLDRQDGTYAFEVNRVNVAQRTIVSTRVHTLAPGAVIGFKHDTELNKVWVAFPNSKDVNVQPDSRGYRIVQLDY